LVAGTYQTQRRFGKNAPPWKKSRRLVQSKTPANEIDIADGLVDFPATSSIRFFGSKNLFLQDMPALLQGVSCQIKTRFCCTSNCFINSVVWLGIALLVNGVAACVISNRVVIIKNRPLFVQEMERVSRRIILPPLQIPTAVSDSLRMPWTLSNAIQNWPVSVSKTGD